MACQKCNSTSDKCGCQDTALTTPISSNCTTPCIPGCEEYTNAKCVILTDGINDIGIQPGDTLESIVQRLVLAITNPECVGLPSIDGLLLQVNDVDNIDQQVLNLVEGTGITIVDNGNGSVTISCSSTVYTVNNGLNEDPATNFKLGGYLIEDTTIDGDNNSYDLNLDNLNEFTVTDAGTIDLKTSGNYKQTAVNHSFYRTNGDRLLNVENVFGQLTLDGYYASTGVLYTNTPAYVLSVDNLGNILKSPYISEIIGSISGDNGITANTSSNVRLGGPLVTDTIITGGTAAGSPFDLTIGDFGTSTPIGVLSLYANVLRLITPNVAGGTAVAGTVLKLINATTGAVEFGQPITLTTVGTSGAATFSSGVLNIPNYSAPTITADNGLTKTGNNIQLGGTLLANTSIDLDTFNLTITANGGFAGFVINNGAQLYVDSTSVLSSPTFYYTGGGSRLIEGFTLSPTNSIRTARVRSSISSGNATNGFGLQDITNLDNGAGIGATYDALVEKTRWAFNPAVQATARHTIALREDSSTLNDVQTLYGDGFVQFHKYGQNLFPGTPVKLLGVNSAGYVLETDPVTITANNGLTLTGSNIQLGGTLLNSTTIDLNTFNLDIQNTGSFIIQGGTKLQVAALDTLSNPYFTYANNAYLESYGVYTLNNSVNRFSKRTIVTSAPPPQTGFGCYDQTDLEYLPSTPIDASIISTSWELDPAVQTQAKYKINLRDSTIKTNDVLTLYGNGAAKLDQYGAGTFTGTPTYNLGVDAVGNIVETTQSGPLVYVARIDNSGPALFEISNTTGATITASGLGSSTVTLTASSPVFTSGKTVVFFQQNVSTTQPATFPFTVNSTSAVSLSGYINGVLASNSILGFIKIEIYP